jgi:hypothetical protein
MSPLVRLPESSGGRVRSFPLLSTLTYHLGMNNRPVGDHDSETKSQPIDIINNQSTPSVPCTDVQTSHVERHNVSILRSSCHTRVRHSKRETGNWKLYTSTNFVEQRVVSILSFGKVHREASVLTQFSHCSTLSTAVKAKRVTVIETNDQRTCSVLSTFHCTPHYTWKFK